MTPISFIILLYRYRKSLENYKVRGKYGSLFLEFKNNKGFISYLFYPVFLIRRIQYMLNQVFYDYDPKGQLAVNIIFSFFNFCYLAYFRPFKVKVVLVSEFIGQICIIFLFLLSIAYLPGTNLQTRVMVDQVFIVVVVISISLQTLMSFMGVALKFIELYRRYQEYRARKLFKKNHKIHPEKGTYVGESIIANPGNTAAQETVKDIE